MIRQISQAPDKQRRWQSDAPPAGVEPATWWVETTCSIQLSYGGKAQGSMRFPAPQG